MQDLHLDAGDALLVHCLASDDYRSGEELGDGVGRRGADGDGGQRGGGGSGVLDFGREHGF